MPLKFSVGGNQGLNIFAAGSPTSQRICCLTLAPVAGAPVLATIGPWVTVRGECKCRYWYRADTSQIVSHLHGRLLAALSHEVVGQFRQQAEYFVASAVLRRYGFRVIDQQQHAHRLPIGNPHPLRAREIWV